MQASRIDWHASNDLVSRRMYFTLLIHRTPQRSCCRRRLQMFTVRHPEMILHMNECRVTIIRSFSPVNSKMMFVWLPATSLRAPFSTTSLFTVSHSLIYLKCSQNWGHSSLQLVSNWFHRSMSWCHRSISTLIGHHHTATRVTVNVYRWLSCKYERTSITHRFVHLQYINNEWMICHILAVL